MNQYNIKEISYNSNMVDLRGWKEKKNKRTQRYHSGDLVTKFLLRIL